MKEFNKLYNKLVDEDYFTDEELNMRKCILEELRKQYPVGSRVELIKMEDVQAPPIGTKGTVLGVDDIGSIMVAWDNGSSLNVVYSVDKVNNEVDDLELTDMVEE